MPKVTAFSIAGLDIYFNSSDHRPPHFHVESNSWHIRVFIDTSSKERGLHYEYKLPKYSSKDFPSISRKQKKLLLDSVLNYKAALLTEWQEKVNTGDMI